MVTRNEHLVERTSLPDIEERAEFEFDVGFDCMVLLNVVVPRVGDHRSDMNGVQQKQSNHVFAL